MKSIDSGIIVFENWIQSIPKINITQEQEHFSVKYIDKLPEQIEKIQGVITYSGKVLVFKHKTKTGWSCANATHKTLEAYKILNTYYEK